MPSLVDQGSRRLTIVAEQTTNLVARASGAAAQALADPTARALDSARSLNPIHTQPAQSPVDGVSAANRVLRQLGIATFTPTIGLSTDMTLPVAVGGAVAGPYTPGVGNLSVAGVSINAVRRGEILCGFVPVGVFGDFGDKSGVRVAWFNLNSLRGGINLSLGGLTDTVLDAVLKRAKATPIPETVYSGALFQLKRALNVAPSNGVRGGLVDTGAGMVLVAVYGTVKRGGKRYVFLPSIGLTEAL